MTRRVLSATLRVLPKTPELLSMKECRKKSQTGELRFSQTLWMSKPKGMSILIWSSDKLLIQCSGRYKTNQLIKSSWSANFECLTKINGYTVVEQATKFFMTIRFPIKQLEQRVLVKKTNVAILNSVLELTQNNLQIKFSENMNLLYKNFESKQNSKNNAKT